MDNESKGFGCLSQKFPKITEAKMKQEIFIGPQITQLSEDQDFNKRLNSTERIAWKALENFCRNFPGNKKAENYSEIVLELISSYSAAGCNM